MGKYYVVHFHADGGQMCVPGHKTFTDKKRAESFLQTMRDEPGHNCGSDSAWMEATTEDMGSEGIVYPGLAMSGRDDYSIVGGRLFFWKRK